MDYKQKYLKYKGKYLSLKQDIFAQGGSNKKYLFKGNQFGGVTTHLTVFVTGAFAPMAVKYWSNFYNDCLRPIFSTHPGMIIQIIFYDTEVMSEEHKSPIVAAILADQIPKPLPPIFIQNGLPLPLPALVPPIPTHLSIIIDHAHLFHYPFESRVMLRPEFEYFKGDKDAASKLEAAKSLNVIKPLFLGDIYGRGEDNIRLWKLALPVLFIIKDDTIITFKDQIFKNWQSRDFYRSDPYLMMEPLNIIADFNLENISERNERQGIYEKILLNLRKHYEMHKEFEKVPWSLSKFKKQDYYRDISAELITGIIRGLWSEPATPIPFIIDYLTKIIIMSRRVDRILVDS